MAEGNLLVIDDEPGIREGCRRALTPQGYRVATAENGEAGLAVVQGGGIDLALIDVMMPGISGIDLITQIHQHDPELVCIIITGYATVELAVRAIKQGAYDFLTKPFTTDELFLVVNQGMERRHLSEDARRKQYFEAEAMRLEEEKARLEELNRAKAAFIRLVTHELQAPIGAILTYLELMLDGTISPEEFPATMQRARERAKEQLALISDLLEFGKLKEIKTSAPPQPQQTEQILRGLLEHYESQAAEKGIKLTATIAKNLPPVLLLPEQIKSLWNNLLSNAVKYSLEGGEVQVVLYREGDDLIGIVRDHGIGIPLESRERLFSEFYRAPNAKELNISGTGLGLAIVKQVVEGAGGKIWYESQPGAGTTFTFSLPVCTKAINGGKADRINQEDMAISRM